MAKGINENILLSNKKGYNCHRYWIEMQWMNSSGFLDSNLQEITLNKINILFKEINKKNPISHIKVLKFIFIFSLVLF